MEEEGRGKGRGNDWDVMTFKMSRRCFGGWLKWKPLHFLKEDGVSDAITKASTSAAGYQSVIAYSVFVSSPVDRCIPPGIQEQTLSSAVHILLRAISAHHPFFMFDCSRQLSEQKIPFPVLFILA
eukprot:765518-Hanusia_phi.AAC.3